MEFSARKDFFLEHILFLEQKKVTDLNNDLERKVKTRTADLDLSNRLLKAKVEELHQSEAAHRNFVDNAPIGMYTINLKGEFTYINKKLEKITGYSAEEWLGKSFHPIVYPDDLDIVQKKFNGRVQGVASPAPYQIRIMNAQNDIMWVKLISELIVEEKCGTKKIVGIQSFVEDSTDIQRSQDINKTLFAISNGCGSFAFLKLPALLVDFFRPIFQLSLFYDP